MLSDQLVEQILQKMGLDSRPGNDLEGLSQVYGRWCRLIPFDNIQKRLFYSGSAEGPVPGHNSTDFFQKWLECGTGGTCWANSHAMHDLLEALGFDVVRVAATMLVTPDAVGPTHGSVFATVDGRRYMVDGSMQTETPVLLEEEDVREIHHPAERVQPEHRDGYLQVLWHPAHRPEGLWCRVEIIDVPQDQFNAFHELTRTRSRFNAELYIRLNHQEQTTTVFSGEKVVTTLEREPIRTPLNREQLAQVLIEDFGIAEETVAKLPADQPSA